MNEPGRPALEPESMAQAATSIHVVFVDDDAALIGLLATFCRSYGIEVIGVGDAGALEKALAERPVDVVLLDVGLPGEDGFSICRRLRVTRPQLPIIVVSGRSDDLDRILGLELGADDYVTKPFVPREMVARIKALYRRVHAVPATAEVATPDRIRFDDFEIDFARRELRRNNEPVPLTNAEFDLLAILSRQPGHALSRSEILARLASDNEVGSSERGIDVTVVRLRKLIEADPKAPKYIRTVWGTGYMFTP